MGKLKYDYDAIHKDVIAGMKWEAIAKKYDGNKRSMQTCYAGWKRRNKNNVTKTDDLHDVITELEERLENLKEKKAMMIKISELHDEIAKVEAEIAEINGENLEVSAENPSVIEKSDITQQAENTDAVQSDLEALGTKSQLSDAETVETESVLNNLEDADELLSDASADLDTEPIRFEELEFDDYKRVKLFISQGHELDDIARIMGIHQDVVYDIEAEIITEEDFDLVDDDFMDDDEN